MPKPQTSRSRRRSWRALSTGERLETIGAAVLIPVAAASLRVCGAKRTIAWFTRASTSDAGRDRRGAEAAERAVRRAARWGVHAGNCLSQSLALAWLLRRRGLAAELRLGARRSGGDLQAHAWVVHDGCVVNDTPDVEARYAALESDP